MEEKATHLALNAINAGKRPFLISRSTFASAGKWTGHWLGDNFSKWQYMYFNIQGVLQFQIFQIPFVGADTCGFNGNSDEELCNRWMQLSAFMPFYRNHNIKGAISQEPYRWDSVAEASRTAINARYTLLPYWVRESQIPHRQSFLKERCSILYSRMLRSTAHLLFVLCGMNSLMSQSCLEWIGSTSSAEICLSLLF